MNILFLIPTGSGGVRDYSTVISGSMRSTHSIEILDISENTCDQIIRIISSVDCVYLQYSGYGYATRGAPLWLLSFLRKHRPSIKRLGIFFHELYAFGLPWSSAFWLSPVQRYVARGLAEISDFWVTNRAASYDWLTKGLPSHKGSALPVFSNMGERVFSASMRPPNILVFGSAALRAKAYFRAGSELSLWASKFNLRIHDVGPVLEKKYMKILDRSCVVQHGKVSVDRFSEIVENSRFGVVSYPTDYISKSGVFAAYCAFGLAPIVLSGYYPTSDGLTLGVHYYDAKLLESDPCPEGRDVSSAAWNWYQDHTIQRHAEILLTNVPEYVV